jgi:outer membrane protein assembly factor BamA
VRLLFYFLLFIFSFSNCLAGTEYFFSLKDDSTVVSNQFVTTDSGKVFINSITIIGNKKTKRDIILRELTFQEGDSVFQSGLAAEVQRSKENLLNTSLFNFVEVFYKQDVQEILVIVSERWYIWPLPIFELVDRNFNEWVKKKDFSRVNYGLYLSIYNFRGRNETLSLSFRGGYTQKYALQYTIPYIDRSKKTGISFQVSYSQNHEMAYDTYHDTLRYYKDESENVHKEFFTSIQFNFRKKLYNTSSIKLEYDDVQISDSVVSLNPEYFNDQKSRQKYFGLSYIFKRDHRDLVSYPLRGTYFDFEAVKRGFDILDDDVVQLYVASSFRYHAELTKNIFIASGIKGKFSGRSRQPYNVTRALGYGRDYVRGYEYYVTDGQNFLLLKNNLKFRLLPTFVKKFSFIPSEKFSTIPFSFYLNLFYDIAYVRDRQFADNNTLPNEWLPGYGVGIDFSSYYDIVIRVEYSINKFAEDGFYFHFTLSI